ncbi:MAG: 4Fe-4S binding protein [Candidatus Aminicenantes bacterium]|nr:4Fe-4S binding protein [Candidatus Aminicenantes bacterium]
MNEIYKKLARNLDRIPNGFPETESGVELKILAKLFTPEQAEVACRMSIKPQLPREIAEKAGKDERETYTTLKAMVKKGLIDAGRGEGGLAFKLIPFVVGFYERQNAQIDEEFAQLFETYYRENFHNMMTIKPSVHRVIPIEKTIPLNIDVLPYERASTYIEKAKSWGVLDCICRVQKKLIGQGCSHSLKNCMAISSRARAFDSSDAIQSLTKEEALKILEQADREGLVHSTRNVQDGVDYICNCCSCSCGVLRGLSDYGSSNAVDRSHFYAVVDEDLCSGCEACLDRCHFKAIKISDEICSIDKARCFGCGLCVTTCPTEALRMVQKTASDIEPTPVTEEEWQEQRAKGREK